VDVLVRLHERWDELVGAEVAEHAKPVAIERGVLSVVVDNPAWAGHLRWAEAEVVRQLDGLLGRGAVTRIRVRVGR
jgi:predicted nucleic acid-binding Zn ribbon protein